MQKRLQLVLMVCFAMVGLGLPSAALTDKPNIIVIMTDDMGYSDLGCYGAEIQTPHLDALAHQGVRFSQFYNAGRCSPTRASLMTGLYAHQAGVGHMMRDEGISKPGYRGRLMPYSVTIAEVLRPAGYRTIMTGKWHLGSRDKAWWPTARGFDRFYGCPQGGGFYFRPSSFNQERHIVRDEQVLYDQKTDPPKGWYATDAFTDEGLAYVEESVEDGKPFFWYLAYNAPHFPLQAKPEDIAKYRGKYKIGWDKLRKQRYKRLGDLGLIDLDWPLPPRDRSVPEWDSLNEKQKDKQDLRMATYAAMIDCVDQNVGKIIERLKALDQFDNTLILFLADNGGDASGGKLGSNKGTGEVGTAESFAYYGTSWANVSDVPFRKFKADLYEGGIATPMIAHWPKGIAPSLQGKIIHEPAHVIDIMPLSAEIARANYPATHRGHTIIPVEGKSLLPLFQDRGLERHDPLFFEHEGNRAVRDGRWKLVAEKGGAWQLFDMHDDRTEMHDLAKVKPAKVKSLSTLYDEWSKRAFVKR
ncbi:MAG: arylsulfatase [Phycisphaeraceae bacterium]